MSTISAADVDELHEGSSDRPFVTAVVVARDGHLPWLSATAKALLAQTRRPDRIVVVDGTEGQSLRTTLAQNLPHLGAIDLTVVKAAHDEAFAALVDRAVQSLPARSNDHVVALRARRRARPRETHPGDRHNWLWLLHEDSAPTSGSLAALLHCVGRSERLGIVGCKINELDRPDRLVNVGIDVTASGRHVARTADGELDQGQHDGRRDVLAVASSGMLVRQDVYLELGGFDPAFDGDGDGLDLCWRAHLAGHAVAVVPEAVAHQDLDAAHLLRVLSERGTRVTRRQRRALSRRAGDPDRPAAHSAATLRRHRQVALARTDARRLPLSLVWTSVSSALLALALLVVKRPRRAMSELGQAGAPLGLVRILGARRRFRGRAVIGNARLASLFVPASVGRRAAWDAFVEAVTPAGSRRAAAPVTSETGPTSEDAEELAPSRGLVGRILVNPGVWSVVALLAAGVFVLRDPLTDGVLAGQRGLAGGSLDPWFASSSQVWKSWRDAWQGPGFGHAATSVPYLPFLAVGAWVVGLLPWVEPGEQASVAVASLFVAAPALAGWSAYLAGRVATHRRWPRAAAALLWGSAATTTTALAGGRLGPLVAAVVLPLLLAGLACLARQGTGLTVTAATALAATIVIAFAPILALFVAAALLAVATSGSAGSWKRALAVALAIPVMLGHWSLEAAQHPARFVGGPGTLTSDEASDPLATLMLHPGAPGSSPLLLALPVLAVGLLGAARGRGRNAARWALVVATLLGYALAFMVARTSFAAPAGTRVWAGLPLMVGALCLLALGLLGLEAPRSATNRRARRIRMEHWAAAGALAVASAATAATAVAASDSNQVHAVADPVPALVAHEADGPRAALMLELAPEGESITYTVHGREVGLPALDPSVTPMSTPASVAAAIASLGDAAGDRTAAVQTLRRAGIGFVAVSNGENPHTLDLGSADGLVPMASSPDRSLYRVEGEGEQRAARVALTDGRNRTIVPVADAHARVSTTVPDGGARRTVTVAAAAGFADEASVTLDGRALPRVADAALPTYRLGTHGGQLVITPGTAWPWWRAVQIAVIALVTFLAVPFGSARSRERA